MAKIKNILLVYKKSAYSVYFPPHRIRQLKAVGKFFPEEVKRFERTHSIHYATLAHIEKIIRQAKIPYKKISRGRRVDYDLFDCVITVGGDGTFMEASHQLTTQVILGVNSDPLWSVGRFCSANSETFLELFERLMQGKHRIKRLNRLKMTIDETPVTHILNDILICHRNPAAMSRYYLTVNGRTEEQKSSGIWIATAAGSSGAVKSAGGILLKEESKDIQYRPRELYSAKTFGYVLTGGIVQASASFKVTSLMQGGVIYVDGSHLSFPFNFGMKAVIRRALHPLKMVH